MCDSESGFEPRAILPFTLTIDIEGDQWTFVKCPAADLQALYGIDVIELNVYRPLVRHIEAQLALGRPTIVEASHVAEPVPVVAATDADAES